MAGDAQRNSAQRRERKRFWLADALFDDELLELLAPFELKNFRQMWLPFDGGYVDMGMLALGSRQRFRVTVRNRAVESRAVQVDVRGMPDVAVEFDAQQMAPGLSRVVTVDVQCRTPGEHVGAIFFTAHDPDGRPRTLRECPLYVNVVTPPGDLAPMGAQPAQASGSSRPQTAAAAVAPLSPSNRHRGCILALPSPTKRLQAKGDEPEFERFALPASLLPAARKPASLATARAALAT